MPRHWPRANILWALEEENLMRDAAAHGRNAMEESSDDSDSSCNDWLVHDHVDTQFYRK